MNPWKGLNKLPKNVWLLSGATLINRSGTMVLPFLAIYLTKVLGISTADAGVVLTFYGVGSLIVSPFVGKLSDRVGALNVMKFSLILTGLVLFTYSFATGYHLIMLITLVWAIVSESFRPAIFSLISMEADTGQRKTAFALNRLAVNLGMSIGPIVGGLLSQINFHLLFFVDGITSILAGIFLIFSPWKPFHKVAHENDMYTEHLEKKSIFRNGKFLYFLLAIIPVEIVFFQHFGAYPLYMVNVLGFKQSVFGFLIAINTVMIIFIEVPLNNSMANVPSTKSIAMGAFLCGLGFGAMAFSYSIIPIIITIIIWTFGEMIFFPAVASMAAELSPESKRGEYMGYFQTTFSLSFILAPWIGTQALQNYGSVVLWTSAFFVSQISVLLILRLKNENVQTDTTD